MATVLLAACSGSTAADTPVLIAVEPDPTLAATAVAPTVLPEDDLVPTEPTAVAVATLVPSPTLEPTPTAEVIFTCPAGFCAHIEQVRIADAELLIDWSAHGFTPAVTNFHAHFYFDTFTAIEVGSNFAELGAARQGNWQVTDSQPFSTAGTAVSMGAIPPGATQICVVAADSGHGVASPENAECAPIPRDLLSS